MPDEVVVEFDPVLLDGMRLRERMPLCVFTALLTLVFVLGFLVTFVPT